MVSAEKHNIVGDLNQGWSVAKRLLQYERTLMSELSEMSVGPKFTPAQAALHYLPLKDGVISNTGLRQKLAQYDMDAMSLELAKQKAYEEGKLGKLNPSATSFFKFYATELDKRRGELKLAIMGSQGLGWEGDGFDENELLETRSWAQSKALTIAGGSSEIQLNVIAKRVLNLPD
jgi:acyl-CoA dehydrogenase